MYLRGKSSEGLEIRFELTGVSLDVGRDSSNDIVIDDPTVSGFHAKIITESGTVNVIDLNSRNGTSINGRRISDRTVLGLWDKVCFGQSNFELASDEARRPAMIADLAESFVLERIGNDTGGPERISVVDDVMIGTAASGEVSFNHPGIERYHAEIRILEDGAELVDFNSTAGTLLNGQHISRARLTPGDVVSFAGLEYRLLGHGSPDQRRKTRLLNSVADDETVWANVRSAPVSAPAPPTRVSSVPESTPRQTSVYQPQPVNEEPVAHPTGVMSASDSGTAKTEFDIQAFLFSPRGRTNRAKFWIFSLSATVVVYAIAYLAFLSFGTLVRGVSPYENYSLYVSLVSLVTVFPSVMVWIKRLHDQDRSGHWLWFMAVPIANLVLVVVLGFIRGTPNANRYGPPVV